MNIVIGMTLNLMLFQTIRGERDAIVVQVVRMNEDMQMV